MRSSRSVLSSFSRMLDMGGMPSAVNATKMKSIDASKNCKVRCIAFDFDLLTRSTSKKKDDTKKKKSEEKKKKKESTSNKKLPAASSILPQESLVQEMANLLNVTLGGERSSNTARKSRHDEEDDLSLLTGERKKKEISSSEKKDDDDSNNNNKSLKLNNILPTTDIRAKYASKLRQRASSGEMSIDGIERAKQQIDDTLRKGDAASHLSARAIAINQGNSGSTKWMALSGTGTLLQYVSSRNMKIALLPIPKEEDDNLGKSEEEKQNMKAFTKQLPHISFDLLLSNETKNNTPVVDTDNEEDKTTTDALITNLMNEISIVKDDPNCTLVISDRDDYLRSAKSAGMTTCRVRTSPNAPRGNITAHYHVTDIAEVQDVINEINGISFNTVLGSSSNSALNTSTRR